MKTCRVCGIEKPETDFYKSKKHISGIYNECKACHYIRNSKRYLEKKKDPIYMENKRTTERRKRQEGFYGTKSIRKHKPYKTPKEKNAASQALVRNGLLKKGFHAHHWSYNKGHQIDVIYLSVKDHHKAHRFIYYDQERFMYRRCDNHLLLDTKERHEEYIFHCIKNLPD